MKPPYSISSKILTLISSISEKIGEINASFLGKPSPQLRKRNKIKTIHSSLAIEGNSLNEEQITAIIENKRVLGKRKDIIEVNNAIQVYDNLGMFNPYSKRSFLKAHKILMNKLVNSPGKFRTEEVGIFNENQITHLAPPAKNVPSLMDDLFEYIKLSDEPVLIKSSVFHYEMEFIHPFIDGNGTMGRLWQTVILMDSYPVFEYLPFETLIAQTQNEYYQALEISDKEGNSTLFIEYMLEVLLKSVNDLILSENRRITADERLEYFLSLTEKVFTRRDYMNVFKNISPATASRDLKKGVEKKLFERIGDKNSTKYIIKS